jgi:hypothetical protein
MTRLPRIGSESEPTEDAESPPESMSLMGGIAGKDEDAEFAAIDQMSPPSGASKLWSSGVLLIVLVAVVAAGALYAMRLTQDDLSGGTSTAQVETKIEMYLAKLSNPGAMAPDDPLQRDQIEALFKDTDEAIRVLASDPAKKQVPVEYVQKNPFALRIVRQTTDGPVDDSKAAMEAQARRRALDQEFKRLNLQSVSDMRVPVATINGEFYRKGDTLGSFKIDAISAKHQAVKLLAGEDVFVLMMEQQLQNGTGR